MVQDYATIGAVLVALASIFTVLKLWSGFTDRITEANSAAKSALQEAAEAKEVEGRHYDEEKKEIGDLRLSIVSLDRAFSLYQVAAAREAKEYLTRQDLREMETRMTATISDSGKIIHGRLDTIVKDIAELHADRRTTRAHQ